MVLQIDKKVYFNIVFGNIESEIDFLNNSTTVEHKEFRKLIPLAYYRLKKKKLLFKLSDKTLEIFQKIYKSTIVHNLLYLKEIEYIRDEFNKVDIKFVILKGVALLELEIYKVGLRPMNDIDILIPPENMAMGINILKKIGYIQFKNLFESDHCINLGKKLINIGLHKNITVDGRYYGISSFTFDYLYERTILSNDLHILEPTLLFFHLIVHLVYSHGFVGLLQITDIIKFYFKFNHLIDFEKLKFISERYHMEVGVNQFFYILSNDFNIQTSYKIEKNNFLIENISKYGINENFSTFIPEFEAHNIVPLFLSSNIKDFINLILSTLFRKFFRRDIQ